MPAARKSGRKFWKGWGKYFWYSDTKQNCSEEPYNKAAISPFTIALSGIAFG